MADCNYKVRRLPDGRYEATLTFDAGVAPVDVSTKGRTQQEALARAASATKAIVESPLLQAVLPPGSALAVRAIQQLASSKDVRAAMSKVAGPGARRLAKALGF